MLQLFYADDKNGKDFINLHSINSSPEIKNIIKNIKIMGKYYLAYIETYREMYATIANTCSKVYV